MRKFKGLLLAMLASATFGFIPLFSIPLLQGGKFAISADANIALDSVCLYRFAFASFFMWLICKFKKVSLKMSRKELVSMAVLSIFYASTSIFLTASYKYMPSGTATTIHFFYPVVVASAMMLFFHEKFSAAKAVAIIAGIAGVFFLSGGFTGERVSIIGFLLVLVTIITYPTYIVGVNRTPVVMGMNGMKMTFYVLLFSALLFLCNVLVRGAHFAPLVTGNQWASAIALAIIPTLVSDFALIYAVQMVGSTVTAILGCMEPLVAVINGLLFFNEKFSWAEAIGMALVFAAVFIIILTQSKNTDNENDKCEEKNIKNTSHAGA